MSLYKITKVIYNDNIFILYTNMCMCAKLLQSSGLLRPSGLQTTKLLCPWDSPGKNTVVGCHVLLQGIFPIQGQNPHLLNSCIADGFFTAEPLGGPYINTHICKYTHIQICGLPRLCQWYRICLPMQMSETQV